MGTQFRTIVNGALLALVLLGGSGLTRAANPIDPPFFKISQQADQLVAITKPGYHTALFSTTPKDKFAFASRPAAVAAPPPCSLICRRAVIQYPDLTPLVYTLPTAIYGTSDLTLVVDVVELNGVATSGLITVKVTRDSRAALSFSPKATRINSQTVQNEYWSFSDTDPNYYVLTTSEPIEAGNKLSFGLTGSLTPGATKGLMTTSVVVLGTAIGEVKALNNSDADKVDYFQQ